LDPDKKREIPELLLRYGSQAEDVILKLSAQVKEITGYFC